MQDLHPGILKADLFQGWLNLFLIPHQVEGGDTGICFESQFGASDDDFATVVATHDIHCDSHRHEDAEGGLPRPEMESSASGHGENLPALVKATRRADAMRYVGGVALRAGAQLRQAQHAVIRAAHALTAM